jgi:hypothetical protein
MCVDESDGRARGLALFWNVDNKLISEYVSSNCIDVIFESCSGIVWRFTGFYGEPKWEDRHLSWDRLRGLNNRHGMPWIVIGDFNEIMYSDEKEGGNPRPQGYMQAFRDVLSDCELFDLGFNGDPFT